MEKATSARQFKYPPATRSLFAPHPILQWASGLPTTDRRIYVGWMVEAKWDSINDAAVKAGMNTVQIKHGSGTVSEYWDMSISDFVPICTDVQTFGEAKSANEKHGIALGWRAMQGDGHESYLNMFVVHRKLAANGWVGLLKISLKSTITSNFMLALLRHYDVLDQAAKARGTRFPYYAFSMNVGATGVERKGTGASSSEVHVMGLVNDDGNPIGDEIPMKYLANRYTGNDTPIMDFVEANMESAKKWSSTYSPA